MKYITILRGINVGGKRKILMADLKAMFLDLGFENVSTYIQSGNVFFSSSKEPSKIEISKAIESKFGFKVPVLIISNQEIEQVVSQNPYLEYPIEQLHVTFLSEVPSVDLISDLLYVDYSPDQFKIEGKVVYLYIHDKYHKSKLSNNLFEKKLKVIATTRNWKTVLKLLELSKE